MAVEEAWEHVKKWNFEGKKDEALRGAKEIVKFFPDHEAKDLVTKLQGEGKTRFEQLGSQFTDTVAKKLDSLKEPVSDEEAKKKLAEEDERIAEAKTRLTTNDERLYGALSYAYVLVFIPLLFKKDSEFVKFHAKQGLVLFIIFYLLRFIIIGILAIILGNAFAWAFSFLLFFGLIFLAFQAWSGKWFEIPVIHRLSRKIPL